MHWIVDVSVHLQWTYSKQPEIMENVTTPDQYELLEMSKISGFIDRARGTGRPTKKDRRSLEEFTAPEFMDDFDFDFDFDEDK